MSYYSAIAISALVDGIFVGYTLKTGVDASPSGIGIQIINVLEPLVPSQMHSWAEFYKILIFILPWIFTAIAIIKAPRKIVGLIVFVVSFITGMILIYVLIH